MYFVGKLSVSEGQFLKGFSFQFHFNLTFGLNILNIHDASLWVNDHIFFNVYLLPSLLFQFLSFQIKYVEVWDTAFAGKSFIFATASLELPFLENLNALLIVA